MTLAKEFGSMKNLFQAQHQRLQQCPGIGPKKVRFLLAAFDEPFFADTVVEELSSSVSDTAKNTSFVPTRAKTNELHEAR